MVASPRIAQLRTNAAKLAPASHGVLSMDGAAIDLALGGGLALGALHAVEGEGLEAEMGAVTAAFLVTLMARLPSIKPVFWLACSTDLYAPGLLSFGFDPQRLIQVRPTSDDEILACMEMLLRSTAPVCVVAEIGQVSRLAARRLQMACLKAGCTGFLLHRWHHGRRETTDVSACVTRWRLGSAPSQWEARSPGRPRWNAALLYTRAGPTANWILEQENGDGTTHPFRVVADLAHSQVRTASAIKWSFVG